MARFQGASGPTSTAGHSGEFFFLMQILLMDSHHVHLTGTPNQPPQQHNSRLAVCHDVTVDSMTHRWVPGNVHSTSVSFRERLWLAHTMSPKRFQRRARTAAQMLMERRRQSHRRAHVSLEQKFTAADQEQSTFENHPSIFSCSDELLSFRDGRRVRPGCVQDESDQQQS